MRRREREEKDPARQHCWTVQWATISILAVFGLYWLVGYAAFNWGHVVVGSSDASSLLVFNSVLSTLVVFPLGYWLCSRRRPDPRDLLALRPVRWRTHILWIVVAIASMLAFEEVRPATSHPYFLLEASGGGLAHWIQRAVFVAIAALVAAPFLEEFLFRAFVPGVLRALGLPLPAGLAVALGGFALMHGHYSAFDLAAVVLLGIVASLARWHSGSILPSLSLHSASNAVAFAFDFWNHLPSK